MQLDVVENQKKNELAFNELHYEKNKLCAA
jgi:hypothetical protein